MIEPKAYKINDAATYLGVSRVSIRRLVRQGRLQRVMAFRHLVITKASLDKLLAGEA
jgi:excisionase family DNA binding protein